MPYSKKSIRKRLFELKDEKYRDFSSKLLPYTDKNTIIGVRIPILRKLAAEIYKNSGTEYLEETDCVYFEEIMLEGMIIGLVKNSNGFIINHIKNFIPKIDNWSVCDCFCASLKCVKGNEDIFFNFIKFYILSKNEYEIRFAVVMLLNYYINDKYIDEVLELLKSVKHNAYYVKMAVAWALSMCYVKYPEKTFRLLKEEISDKQVFDKTVQKICESYQADSFAKKKVRELKKLKQF